MAWDDRKIPFDSGRGRGGRGGGLGDALGRMFSQPFFAWAVPLYTAWGIRVKLHILFIIMMVAELLQSISHGAIGVGYAAILWGSIWSLVLLHEYGHCFTCRRVGGEADEIVLWPLGGLAMCRPPHEWRAELWTVVGGPAVNAALIVPLGALVLVLGGGWEAVVFNPFRPDVVLAGLAGSWWLIAAWSLYYANMVLLGFNVLLPMFPMDGGRILQTLLWARIGHRAATRAAATTGLVVAVALGVFSIVFDQGRLLGLAIFGGFTCFGELQRLKMMGDFDDEAWRGGPGPEARAAVAQGERERKRRAAEAARVAAEEAEVNRLLDKIRDQGMQSLSGKERRFLEEATKRRRGA